MSKTTDIITMATRTIIDGNEYMREMQNATSDEAYTLASEGLANQWIRLANLFQDLTRVADLKP